MRKLIAFARGWDRSDAAGRALLCRHQPLDRGRVRDRLRAQPARAPNCRSRRSCGSAPTPPRPTAASCRSPTTCSAATAAWSTPSKRSGPARPPPRRSRSGWSSHSASAPASARPACPDRPSPVMRARERANAPHCSLRRSALGFPVGRIRTWGDAALINIRFILPAACALALSAAVRGARPRAGGFLQGQDRQHHRRVHAGRRLRRQRPRASHAISASTSPAIRT